MALPSNIAQKVRKDSSEVVRRSVEKQIQMAFNKIKTAMIREFLNHPVTEEIKNGPDSPNLSGTLNGYGNLFSYIGFYEGDDPIKAVLEEFEKSTIVYSGLVEGGASWKIYIPNKQDIWDASPMPWAQGRSWAKGIETGISGVGYYLYSQRRNMQNSRSGPAVQTENKITRPRFKNVKYISAILDKYEEKFSQLDEASIST